MTCSSGTKVRPSPTGTKRGSISFGTFTRAKVSWPVTGSRTSTASESERLEMYGNGRPRPTASGVSTGKIWRRKRASSSRRSWSETSSIEAMRMPCSAERRARARSRGSGLAPAELAHARLDRVDRLARRHAVGPAGVDAGVELVVQAGDADHEELVQVRGVDRAELHALEQRHGRCPRRAGGRGR